MFHHRIDLHFLHTSLPLSNIKIKLILIILQAYFQRIKKKSDIKARVLYNLRHTFASPLISKDADIVYVSKMLGHKDVSIKKGVQERGERNRK